MPDVNKVQWKLTEGSESHIETVDGISVGELNWKSAATRVIELHNFDLDVVGPRD